MHDKEEDLLFSKSLFLTVTLLLGCNKEEEDRIGNRGFCFRPVANPDVQTTFVVAAAVCILESVWLQRDVKEKRNARCFFRVSKLSVRMDVCFRKIKVIIFIFIIQSGVCVCVSLLYDQELARISDQSTIYYICIIDCVSKKRRKERK